MYNPASSIYQDLGLMRPLYSIVGFYDKGLFKKESRDEILEWMIKMLDFFLVFVL